MSRKVHCWPEGVGSHGQCDATLPDDDHETIERFGWGFGWANDPYSESGQGPFLMCPEHREYESDEEREEVRRALEDRA